MKFALTQIGVPHMPRKKEVSSIHAQARLFIMELLCTHSLSSVAYKVSIYWKLIKSRISKHLPSLGPNIIVPVSFLTTHFFFRQR